MIDQIRIGNISIHDLENKSYNFKLNYKTVNYDKYHNYYIINKVKQIILLT